MIEIEHLSVQSQQTPVFENFSLSLRAGEKMAVSGRSGTGKSTLLNALMGFVRADTGRIIVNGLELGESTIGEIRQQIAWLPQELGLGLETAGELFYYPYTFKRNKGIRPSEASVEAMLNKLELSGKILEKRLADISGGQKQRLLIASLLLMNRPLMLFDEPTSALDRRSSDILLAVLTANTETTMLAATHDQTWQQRFDRLISLDGKQ